MPELPEVETIRRGLEPHVLGKRILSIETFGTRVIRHSPQGLAHLTGSQVTAVVRRGKFLWFDLGERCLVAHLGMSGQFRIGGGDFKHRRATFHFDDGSALDFVDQRTFGYLRDDEFAPTSDGYTGGFGSERKEIPISATHIGRDLLDPNCDFSALAARARLKKVGIKTLLLDQSFASGVGNIYADEALFLASVHGALPACDLPIDKIREVFDAGAQLMNRAVEVGGTSFDSLYVNVNGSSGYFSRSLNVYGRDGHACPRCGKILIREKFMGRSSYSCPKCQTRP
ncbi:bifunctional DNA-formamidopyrimidine glycosylase/DNA-(apurinic or apyrimidinic site) lyase [Arcanobacterium bovis]|uniref:Bifunctional DNA-formamidopyrimidine glycosylase/DNA-(Apurinic or apyrimidinic site) lyase n=1 Tax=Arcanobacterium bovis TaxID=2529275 RepID=A0A4Q9V1Q6_9ACTO|nr:bifunctional DNA-formamidopyrimidine glycosylase/DNA-(apurinic or apyrimidinic site) lyase [Arcanobacterium bovis]TBW22061.1 bifunctional DNA-formamidopyrimidine glycosylase/DNA-(apurinic or apyrimidinic site) lyase [Arcanobacterium bovis]